MFALFGVDAAAIPPPHRYCPHEVADLKALDSAADRKKQMLSLLAGDGGQGERFKCLAEQLGTRDVDLVLSTLEETNPLVRQRAAIMLAAMRPVSIGQVQALAGGLRKEKDPQAASALVGVAGAWFPAANRLGWTSGLSRQHYVDMVVKWPGFGDSDHAMRFNAARAAALYHIAFSVSQQDLQDASLAPALINGALASLNGAPVALDVIASVAERAGLAGIEPETRSRLVRALLHPAGHPEAQLRAPGMAALASVLSALARLSDPYWSDFGEGLQSSTVNEVAVVLGQGLADPVAPVRAHAARASGALMRYRPMHIERLTVLLGDADEAVRSYTALALARLQVLPPASITPLLAMLRRDKGYGTEAAAAALSNSARPEVIAGLLDAVPEEAALLIPDHPSLRALRKIGGPAAVPTLRKMIARRDEQGRQSLYATLEAIGWQRAIPGDGAMLEAVGPALTSPDADTRLLGVTLLAKWRPYAEQLYPPALVDRVVREYLDIPADMPAVKQTQSQSVGMLWGSDTDWRIDPQVAAVTVAGNSSSAFAAEHLVRWMCSGRRLETGAVTSSAGDGRFMPDGQLDTVRDSLSNMGPVAVAPVLGALLRGAPVFCEETLFETLAMSDIDGADTRAVELLVAALDSKVAGLRQAALHQLARTPDLPAFTVAPLLRAAKGEGDVALLATRALLNLHPTLLKGGPGWPDATQFARARAMPPSSVWLGDGPRELYVYPSDLVTSRLAGIRSGTWVQQESIGDRLSLIDDAGILRSHGRDAVPFLIQALRSGPALVRERAVQSLGLIGSADAASALREVRPEPGSALERHLRLAFRRIALQQQP